MSTRLDKEKKRLVLQSDMQRALLGLDIARLKRSNNRFDAVLGLADMVLTLKRLFAPSDR